VRATAYVLMRTWGTRTQTTWPAHLEIWSNNQGEHDQAKRAIGAGLILAW